MRYKDVLLILLTPNMGLCAREYTGQGYKYINTIILIIINNRHAHLPLARTLQIGAHEFDGNPPSYRGDVSGDYGSRIVRSGGARIQSVLLHLVM